MWLLGLSLRSFARSLRSATGLRPGPLAALGVAVLALCAAATALSVSSVLSLDLMLLDPAMQRDLIGALGRAAFLAGGVLGLFLALITVPGEGMRLVMRQNRGSAVDLYLLMYGARDVLTPVIGLVLSAVAWVPAAYLLGDQGSAAAATALAALIGVSGSVAGASAMSLLRTAGHVCAPRVPPAVVSGLSAGVTLAVLFAVFPLPLLPWQPLLPTLALGRGNDVGVVAVLVSVGLVLWLLGSVLPAARLQRSMPALQPWSGLRWVSLLHTPARAPMLAYAVVRGLRGGYAPVMMLAATACAVVGLLDDDVLLRTVVLTIGCALAGSIGLRMTGLVRDSQWVVLSSRPAHGSWSRATWLAGALLALLAGLPVLVVAAVTLEFGAVVYFAISLLTTYSACALGGTVAPVTSEEPLSMLAAAAIAFAASGGVVGIVRAGLLESAPSLAAAMAIIIAAGAAAVALAVASARTRRAVIA